MYNPCANALIWATLLLSLLSSVGTASVWVEEVQWGPYHFIMEIYRPTGFWCMSPNSGAQHVLKLQQRPGNGRSTQYAQALQRGPANTEEKSTQPQAANSTQTLSSTSSSSSASPVSSPPSVAQSVVAAVAGSASQSPTAKSGVYGSEALNTTNKGLTFVTTIQLGNQSFQTVVDTGSSDTWVIQEGYQCTDPTSGDIVAPSQCNFGPSYRNSSSFTQIPNQNFHQAYTDGESLSGILGTETITVAGIQVPAQEMAVVNSAAYDGDGVSSGLLGLAFPANTRAYSGTNPATDSVATQEVYNPVFTNMYTSGNVSPMFSLALDRSGGGLLAFGGLPPVSYTPSFASSPLQILQTSSPDGAVQNSTAYTFYTITIDGFAVGGATAAVNDTTVQVIVDSGTTQNYVPEAVADAVNYAFSPPPFYKDDTGDYIVPCTAKPPSFSVVIGGKTFTIDAKDMIINQGGRCISGVAATGASGTSILGHSFLKNVVAVFDVGAQMMRFAPHIY